MSHATQLIEEWVRETPDTNGLAYALLMLAKAEWIGTEGDMVLGTLPGGFTFGVIRRETADGVKWEVHS